MADPFSLVNRALDRTRAAQAVTVGGRPRKVRDPSNPQDVEYLRAMHPDFDEVMGKADVDYRTRCKTDADFASKFRIPPLVEPKSAFKLHQNSVDAVCWGPEVGHFVSASHDSTLRVWNASTGACTDTLTGHSGAVFHCAVSSSRQTLISCGAGTSNNVLLWKWPEKKVVQSLAGHRRSVVHASLSGHGLVAATADQDGTVVVHDLARSTATMQKTLHLGVAHGTSFCREDPNLLATFGADGFIHMLDLREQTTRPVWLLPSVAANCVGAWRSLRSLAAAHDGRAVHAAEYVSRETVISGGADNKLKCWDLRATSSTAPVAVGEYLGHTSTVRCLTVSPDGQFLVSGCEDGSCRVWRKDALADVQGSLKADRRQLQELEAQVQDASLAVDVRRGLTERQSTLKDTIAMKRAREEQLVRDGHHSAARLLHGHTGIVASVAWQDAGDKKASVLSASWDQSVMLFPLRLEELSTV